MADKMNPTLKWGLIIGGGILFLALAIGAFFLLRPTPDLTPTPDPTPDPDGNGNGNGNGNGGEPDCVPFTKKQRNSVIIACSNKCATKHLWKPFVGVTLYATCVQKCKTDAPPIVEC